MEPMMTPGMPAMMGAMMGGAEGQQAMPREVPQPPPERAALVKQWQDKVRRAKSHHKPAFDRIRDDMDFALGNQWLGDDGKSWVEPADKYTVNVVQRHIQQRVAALYAKNPKAIARRRQRLDFAIWDGTAEMLNEAYQKLAAVQQQMAAGDTIDQTGTPIQPDPNVVALLQDVQQGMVKRKQLDQIAKALEMLFAYSMDEQIPKFKTQMKQAVRRAVTTGVAYVKLGFQRAMEKHPDTQAAITDAAERLATIDRLRADLQDDRCNDQDAEAEELRLALQALMSEPEVIIREGLTFNFPETTRLIVDPKCRRLTGFIGADWVCEEFPVSVEEIKELYGLDIGRKFTAHAKDGQSTSEGGSTANTQDGCEQQTMLWHLYDKDTGLKYVMVDGYPDFLTEPARPEVEVERFFPYYTLIFNEIEHEKHLYPPSDVRLLRCIQLEYNRIKEALRQHRIASRPLYGAPAGTFEEEDVHNLASHNAHDVLMFKGLKPGDDVSKAIAPIPKTPIDPNFYEVGTLMDDAQRVIGSSEAAMGSPTGSTTATGDSIAEGARVSTLSSAADDLDEMLTDIARDAGNILLANMSEEQVKRIVGPGAVWPQLTALERAEEIYLEIEAGSTGRPNKAQEIANFERLYPFLIQAPGLNPEWLLRHAIKILDDRMDVTDAIIAGLPSITAMNAQKQIGTGDPATDPNAQGAQGGQNTPGPQMPAGGPQPAFTPLSGMTTGGEVAGRA